MGHWLRDDDKFEVVVRVFFEGGQPIENKEKRLK